MAAGDSQGPAGESQAFSVGARTWTPGTPDAPQQQHASGLPTGPVANKREYAIGLLLSIVTLGLYGLWWHWVVHKEMCDFLQRPVEERNLWVAYVVLTIGSFVFLVISGVMMIGMIVAGTIENMASMFAAMGGMLLFLVVAMIAGIVSLVVLLIFVSRQYSVIESVKGRMNLSMNNNVGLFLGLYLGGYAVTTFVPYIGIFGIVMFPIAYWFLHEHYDQVWVTAARWRDRPGSGQTASDAPMHFSG